MSPKLKPEALEERKKQILAAALRCFARKGYHRATMDDIVDEAGLSKGGVYWHFSSKKELFLALFDSLIGDTEAILTAVIDGHANAQDRLRATMEVFAGLAIDDEFREFMPLLIDVWAQNWRDPEVNEVAALMYQGFRRPLVRLIAEGVASGEFKPVNAEAFAGILISLYDGLMVQWMIDETAVDWDTVSNTLANTLVAGLLTEPYG